MLDGDQHDVTNNVTTVTASRRCAAHRLAVATIESERHAQWLAVIAAKLGAIRAPPAVSLRYRHLAFMPPPDASPHRPPVKKQIVHAHHGKHLTRAVPNASCA
jgi:hypothetical protein